MSHYGCNSSCDPPHFYCSRCSGYVSEMGLGTQASLSPPYGSALPPKRAQGPMEAACSSFVSAICSCKTFQRRVLAISRTKKSDKMLGATSTGTIQPITLATGFNSVAYNLWSPPHVSTITRRWIPQDRNRSSIFFVGWKDVMYMEMTQAVIWRRIVFWSYKRYEFAQSVLNSDGNYFRRWEPYLNDIHPEVTEDILRGSDGIDYSERFSFDAQTDPRKYASSMTASVFSTRSLTTRRSVISKCGIQSGRRSCLMIPRREMTWKAMYGVWRVLDQQGMSMSWICLRMLCRKVQQLDPQRSMLRVPCIGGNLVIPPSKCGYLHVQLSSSLEAS